MMIVSLVLAACAATPSIPTTATALPPTQTATPTLIPTPTPVTAILPQYLAGSVVDEQTWNDILQNQFIQEQIKLWQAWINYWAYAETPAIPLDIPLQLNLVFDPTNLPKDKYDKVEKRVNVTLNWKDANGETLRVYFPIDSAETDEESGVIFQTVPPKLDFVEAGTEPMLLSGNIVWRESEWIRIDANGKMTEQIQKVPPFSWEVSDPGKRLNNMLIIVYNEVHSYTLENGVTVNYTLETDATRQDYQVGLNTAFPNAEKTMAWVIDDAIQKSIGADGTMEFVAYWDGESTYRRGKMPRPTQPLRIVFVDRNKFSRFDLPVVISNVEPPMLVWRYVVNDQLIIIIGPKPTKYDKPYQEVGALGFSLQTLSQFGTTGNLPPVYWDGMLHGRFPNTIEILKWY